MTKLFACILILCLATDCGSNKKDSNDGTAKGLTPIDSTLVTDSSWGPITSATDFSGLQKLFGAENVKDGEICDEECSDTLDVTFLFSGTNKKSVVYWKDSAYHKSIDRILCMEEGAPYHHSTGIKIGSTLTELLSANKQKIGFSGFGWDYGGYVHEYNHGVFDSSHVNFRLDLIEGTEDLYGDISLDTDMPSVKKAMDKIVVWQFLLFFPDPL